MNQRGRERQIIIYVQKKTNSEGSNERQEVKKDEQVQDQQKPTSFVNYQELSQKKKQVNNIDLQKLLYEIKSQNEELKQDISKQGKDINGLKQTLSKQGKDINRLKQAIQGLNLGQDLNEIDFQYEITAREIIETLYGRNFVQHFHLYKIKQLYEWISAMLSKNLINDLYSALKEPFSKDILKSSLIEFLGSNKTNCFNSLMQRATQNPNVDQLEINLAGSIIDIFNCNTNQ